MIDLYTTFILKYFTICNLQFYNLKGSRLETIWGEDLYKPT